MLNHCDFMQQITNEEGTARPDLIIKLPAGRQIIVDAKAPMEAYLDAIESTEEEKYAHKLKEHARLVRAHAYSLGKKSYYQYFQPTPEFVILFLPSEHFFSMALQQDPTLIELGVEQGVILATPTTLIALLRTVAYGWKQESLTKHVQQVSQLGQEFYKRLGDMTSHFSKTGRALSSAVDAYNQTIRSLETRVLVSARKFHEMGISSKELEICSLDPIEKISIELTTEKHQP
jgi:DNA recombination protein RmuC